MHAKPPPKDLNPLLPVGRYHIYAIGSEECERSISASAFIPNKDEWEAALQQHVGDDYRVLAAHTLQATHLMVFVHGSLLPIVSDVQLQAVACGLAGTLGNKGGVAIGCTVGKTSLLIVNCHLAAHQNNVEARNADWARIETTCAMAPVGFEEEDLPSRSPFLSDRYDRVIWMGDLNYRIHGSRAAVDALLEEGNHAELLRRDQLRRQLRRGLVFHGFGEAPLRFMPTYKFDHNSDRYDSSEKRRIPGWTDRILVKPPNPHMRILSYYSLDRIRTSDHRPVVASIGVFLRGHERRADDRRAAGAALWPARVFHGRTVRAAAVEAVPDASHGDDEDGGGLEVERGDEGRRRKREDEEEFEEGAAAGGGGAPREASGEELGVFHTEEEPHLWYTRPEPYVFAELTDGAVALVPEHVWQQHSAARGEDSAESPIERLAAPVPGASVVRGLERRPSLGVGAAAAVRTRPRGRTAPVGTAQTGACTLQ